MGAGGRSAFPIVQEALDQSFSFNDEIVDALIENDDARPQDGEEPFFSNEISYVATRLRPYRLHEWWNFVEEDLKHNKRSSVRLQRNCLSIFSVALRPGSIGTLLKKRT